MKTKNLLDIEQFKQIFSYIAIFIELKNLNEYLLNESFLIFIYNSISQIKLNMTLEQFEYTLNLGKYLFLFDGLDEVDPSIMHNAENELKSFINKYEKNNFVISSRPSDSFIGWNEFHEYQLQPLTKKQALSLINKLEYDSDVKRKFHKQLQLNLYDNHESFSSIPLLLTIMLINEFRLLNLRYKSYRNIYFIRFKKKVTLI